MQFTLEDIQRVIQEQRDDTNAELHRAETGAAGAHSFDELEGELRALRLVERRFILHAQENDGYAAAHRH